MKSLQGHADQNIAIDPALPFWNGRIGQNITDFIFARVTEAHVVSAYGSSTRTAWDWVEQTPQEGAGWVNKYNARKGTYVNQPAFQTEADEDNPLYRACPGDLVLLHPWNARMTLNNPPNADDWGVEYLIVQVFRDKNRVCNEYQEDETTLDLVTRVCPIFDSRVFILAEPSTGQQYEELIQFVKGIKYEKRPITLPTDWIGEKSCIEDDELCCLTDDGGSFVNVYDVFPPGCDSSCDEELPAPGGFPRFWKFELIPDPNDCELNPLAGSIVTEYNDAWFQWDFIFDNGFRINPADNTYFGSRIYGSVSCVGVDIDGIPQFRINNTGRLGLCQDASGIGGVPSGLCNPSEVVACTYTFVSCHPFEIEFQIGVGPAPGLDGKQFRLRITDPAT